MASCSDGSSLDSALAIVIPRYIGNDVVKNSGLGDEVGFDSTDEWNSTFILYEQCFQQQGTEHARDAKHWDALRVVMQADIAVYGHHTGYVGEEKFRIQARDIFIMNRGGNDATLIKFRIICTEARVDVAMNGSIPFFMKRGFDYYYFHTKGHMPPPNLSRSPSRSIEGVQLNETICFMVTNMFE